MFVSQDWNGTMLHELVRPADPDYRRMNALGIKVLHHRAPKTVVQNVILHCGNHLRAAREKFERSSIERFDPAWVDQRHRNTALLQFFRCFLRHFKHRAEAKDRHLATVLNHLRLSDFQQFRRFLWLRPSAGATRVTDRDWT